MPFDATFNARTVQPQQSGGKHPPGNKYPFAITNCAVKTTADGKGGRFEVELTSQAGSIRHNYNMWNESAQAREISGKQLSALCHAVGIFDVDFKNDGKALIGGKGLMDIGFQAGQEPSAEKPEGGYVELKKVYDMAGNEPGQAQQAAPSRGFTEGPAPAGQPQAQNGFTQAPAPQPAQQWGAPNTAQQPPQTPPQQPGQGGWQQNAADVPQTAPWGAPQR